MKPEKKPTSIKYLLVTHQNGLGFSYFTVKRITPWYLPNIKVGKYGFPSDYEFSSRELAMSAIERDAHDIRREPLRKYKVVVTEPIEA
jgi:hypothetical protein